MAVSFPREMGLERLDCFLTLTRRASCKCKGQLGFLGVLVEELVNQALASCEAETSVGPGDEDIKVQTSSGRAHG